MKDIRKLMIGAAVMYFVFFAVSGGLILSMVALPLVILLGFAKMRLEKDKSLLSYFFFFMASSLIFDMGYFFLCEKFNLLKDNTYLFRLAKIAVMGGSTSLVCGVIFVLGIRAIEKNKKPD
jgi:hypothetical protein